MSEGDSSKSIDDIFATVSRLGRKAGAAEAATGRAIGRPDAEALATDLASTSEPAVQTSGIGRRTDAPAGDAAVFNSNDLPRDDGNSDAGEIAEGTHQTAGQDRLPAGLEAAAAKAQEEELTNSNSAGAQHEAEGWSADTASVPAHERASDGKPVRDDESTEEELWAEQAAAQLALLARHRADAEKRAHRAEQERRAAEQAAPLACARALTKKLASLAAATKEDRRASKLAAAQAVQAVPGQDNAQSAQGACIEAVPKEEPQAAEESAASAVAEALEPARAEEQGRLAVADEKKLQVAEQAVALAAAEARESVQAKEQTRPAAVSEEDARQATAREAPAEPLREPAGDASPALRMGVAESRTDATPLQAQTPGTGLGRGRALMAVAMAAALVVAAGAVAAFMNRSSGEVSPATRGAFSGTAPKRSVQMLRSPSAVSSTEFASSTAEPVRSLPVSAVAPSPQDVVRMDVAPLTPHSDDDDGRA